MSTRWRVLGLILGVIVKMRAILNKVKKSREKMKLYCCLFPNEYEFERETLVPLWMAMGFTSQSCAENFCERYFDILLEEQYIIFSSIDNVTRRNLYKVNHQGKDNMGEKKTINKENLYTVLEDEDENGSKLGHISLVSNCINETTFQKLQNFDGELRTLLFIHNCGSTLNKIPSDMFLILEFLQALDLSGNDIVELPRSIENVSQLRYLDLSSTLIESLPKSIDQLHQLQTLKLQGCRHLRELPKGIKELICLHHLDLDVLGQLTSLPKGIGALTELCTLSAFIVDSEEGCTIQELKFLNKLRGSLCISGLENVAHVDDVQEAALQDKKYLTHLQLRWSDLILYSNEDKQLGYNIISSLNLNKGLQDLQIVCYPGLHIPAWVNFREQHNLLSITLLNCNNNDLSLPLGQLPNLKYLSIIHMNQVTKIDNWFHGSGDEAYVAFPKLESLKIECMLSLETWIDVCNHDDFPFLSTLIIKQCPKLIRLPFLSHFQVLKFFEISHCAVFDCLPEGTLPASLETLIIDDCPFLKKSCSKEGDDWNKVKHVPNIWIDLQNICSTHEDGGFEDSSSKSEDICSTDEDISEDNNLPAEYICSIDEDIYEDSNLSADVEIPEVEGLTDLARKFIAEIPLTDRSFPKGADPAKYSLPNIPFAGMGSKKQMDESEMMKRARLREMSKIRGSSATPSTHSMPPPQNKAKVDKDVTVLSSPSQGAGVERPVEGITLGFPAGYLSSHEADVGIMPHVEKLLFPAAESRLQTMDIEDVVSQGAGHLLQALQNNLAASKYMKGVDSASKQKSKEIDELNHEVNQLKNTINNFESSKVEEINKVRTEVKAELDGLKQKLGDRDAKITEL